jgi:hypothetical protein
MLSHRARVVLDTLLPDGSHSSLPGVFEAGFDEFAREFSRTATFKLRFGFRVSLLLAIWVAPLLILRPPPLTLYGRGGRERALEAMERSRVYSLRQMLMLLKTTVCLGYGASPRVRSSLGFLLTFDDAHAKAERREAGA